MPVPEAEVLKPVDPSITNSDDWEIFVLSDAQVVYESNGKPASLLDAYADTPLKVIGRLETPARSQLKYLVKKPFKPEEIELRHVTRFSYGEMTDYTYVIWAQGQAGWFEIRPAAQYQAIFDDMIQAVELLYFVTDIYTEPRKKNGGPGPQLVFKEYAEDDRYTCSDPTHAETIFAKHHTFLTMSFLARAQGIGWSNTPLYQYFRRKFPKEFEICKARVEGRYSQASTERQTRSTRSTSASIPEFKAIKAKADIHERRDNTTMGKAAHAPKKDDNWWEAAALFEFMQKAVNQRVMRAGRNQITLERVAELVVRRYEIDEVDMAKNVLLVHARNLCHMMNHPRRQAVRYFVNEPIYHVLSSGHNLSAAEQRRAEGVELRPRKDRATLRDGESEASDKSDMDGDVLSTPLRQPSRQKRGRLSILRPKSAKSSGSRQGKSIKGNQIKRKPPLLESEDDSQEAVSSEDEMSIDTLAQPMSPGLDKRKLDSIDINDNEEDDRRKRVTNASDATESPPSAGSEDEETQSATGGPRLPLRYKPKIGTQTSPSYTKSAMAVPLVSTPLPTYESNGPRDSWICTFDGCSQRIYGCSKEMGRQLITEHLEDHARGREKVVGILWREQDKLQLPVSNLIKKIREMNDASAPLFSSATGATPLPIQRPG